VADRPRKLRETGALQQARVNAVMDACDRRFGRKLSFADGWKRLSWMLYTDEGKATVKAAIAEAEATYRATLEGTITADTRRQPARRKRQPTK
jgi:hypothetical protein